MYSCTIEVSTQKKKKCWHNIVVFKQISLFFRFLVGGNGKVYEGAGWREGAHTKGYNNKSISISFIGDFRGTTRKY